MQVIKNEQPVEGSWTHLGDEEPVKTSPCTVSLGRWLKEREELLRSPSPVGVRLSSADAPETLATDLQAIALIVLDMHPFADGRSFTQARIIRGQLGYSGELRVRGDFLRDQMFFLSRVGVDAFEFPDDVDIQDRLKAFQEFTVTYQAAADARQPVCSLR